MRPLLLALLSTMIATACLPGAPPAPDATVDAAAVDAAAEDASEAQ